MHIGVIVAAAGQASRFQGGGKLDQDLGGRAVLIRAVEAFTRRPEVTTVLVAVPPDRLEELTERVGPTLGFLGAKLVAGGVEARWETVRNAMAHVPDDCTHIAVHDAARPLVSEDLLNRVFEAGSTLAAVAPGVAIRSTIRRVEADAVDAGEPDDPIADAILGASGKQGISARRSVETVPRNDLMAVQTPQLFDADLLRRAYGQDDLSGATDDGQLVERLGEPLHIVDGDPRNIKITTQADLDMVRALFGASTPQKDDDPPRYSAL